MIAFWVVAGVLAAAAAGLILFRAASAGRQAEAPDPTSAVYSRQLAEIDDLAERGLIGEAERRTAHAEAGRRLLSAADAALAPWSADPGSRRAIFAAVALAPALALAVYLAVGRPGMADQPFAKRLAEWRASDPTALSAPELAAVLERLVRERPGDPQAYRYLALAEASASNPAGAVRAVRRAVRIAPERADNWELLGEATMAEADGQVTPEAAAAFREALKRDPKGAINSRFHLARARIEAGDKAGGLADWRALLADMPSDDPRRGTLQAAIAEAESQPVGPAAAGGQLAMIQDMVQGLAQRLRDHPDDPEGWVRLVRAYAVLGDAAKRDDALTQARARYAGRHDVLDQLDAAARAEPMK